MRQREQTAPGGLELVEESIYVLRYAPVNVLGVYYLGALPFILALLYFWGDMSQSAFAQSHLALGSLGLAVAFVWMKCCQAVFTSHIAAIVSQTPPPSWTWRRVTRMAIAQTIVQPSGLFVLPMSFFFVIPFPWVYAWYQSMTVLGDRIGESVWESGQRAASLTKLWPKQNHIMIWMLSPYLVITAAVLLLVLIPIAQEMAPYWTTSLLYAYAFFYALLVMALCPLGVLVAANIGIGLLALPWLLHMFAGIQTVVVQGGSSLSPTFFAIVCSLTYLVMDPLVKTAYTIRCFYGESIKTGRDLRADLKSIASNGAARAFMLVLFAVAASMGAASAYADTPAEAAIGDTAPALPEAAPRVSPGDLDRSIAEVIAEAEYAWRLPRDPLETQDGVLADFAEKVGDAIGSAFKWIGKQVKRFIEWVRDIWPDTDWDPNLPSFSWQGLPNLMMWALILLVAALLGVFLFRLWKQGGWRRVTIHASPVAPEIPDITDEDVGADALPEDGWIAMARDLLARGELRLAVRAMFLACLAHLARRDLILLAKYKSNRDYERELSRRAHAEPDMFTAFSQNISLFERVWYGNHEVTDEFMARFSENQERMTAVAHR